MSCNCRTIVGALGKKVKLIEWHFTADTTPFTAGDALVSSYATFNDVFDFENGNGRVIEFRVTQRDATTVTKKGIAAVIFHTQPASSIVAINAAEGISAIDFVKVAGVASVATADYADITTATETITTAIKTASTDDLPIIWNEDTSNKKATWIKLITTESMTFDAGTLVHVVLQIEVF
jgi:hypothetical protein